MGNCLVLEQKIIKIIKTDGKILEYTTPMKVHQVLSDFAGHAISESMPVHQVLSDFAGHAISESMPALRHLQPDMKLLGGRFYYLIPLPKLPPSPPSTPKKARIRKKVRFVDDHQEPKVEEAKKDNESSNEENNNNNEMSNSEGKNSGVVRIKLVLSKRELKEIVERGGVLAKDEIVSQLENEGILKLSMVENDGSGDLEHHGGWKPSLETISEAVK